MAVPETKFPKDPEPGAWPGVPDEIYHRWPGLSQTTLKVADAETIFHARFREEQRAVKPPTQPMETGSASHTAILEPHLFNDRVVRGLELARRSKADKLSHADHAAKHANQIVLPWKEYDKVIAMPTGMMANATARELFRSPGHTELPIVWIDTPTGLKCRGKFDLYRRFRGLNIIADVKTYDGVLSLDALEKRIGDFGYDSQAAFYTDGANTLWPDSPHEFWWIFVEKKPPHHCRILRAPTATIEEGRKKYRSAIDKWDAAQKTGEWTSWGDDVTDAYLKPWHQFNWVPNEDHYPGIDPKELDDE